ncbi:YdiU family protein [Accumulibacter sp.]|uniref:protein adenylyltransferase SelO n=1 Tax=Accumulibacter sp. TaxID=2053492 RepID=UPI0025F5B175|nr:YdiU family protein [Accumulibacter sp.]MCM8595897.1 YdiU family protein [Accumulibacter sp.]MCM8626470.1 YdiU family protein [Accumulibacter sp.]MDS4050046.1 YdiU family protein [Accumulibacter sp.]
MLRFDNRFLRELPGDPEQINEPRQVHGACWSAVATTPVAAPRLVAYAREVAEALDLGEQDMARPELVAALAGNALLPGMVTYACCYGGHQFGHWAGQLGDGRAIFLGEAVNRAGQRFELQLKGAGPTPYSRRADGRAVLRSSIREFLCSEAMHHLGVPTTRSLSLVSTGEKVVRDMFYDGHPVAEPGAVVCRVAPSFTRFGHFEIFAARGDQQLLQRFVEFTIRRDFPELDLDPARDLAGWFSVICERTARLLAHWMRVGFVHGVMNTDNMSILGLTIDYGPYGWIDNFDPGWTPNTTDASSRRYCFARQPAIARWNLERLADALAVLSPSPADLAAGLEHYDAVYAAEFCSAYAAKLGLRDWHHDDADLLEDLFDLMHRAEIDMTDFFRSLAALDVDRPAVETVGSSFYRDDLRQRHADDLARWLARYAARLRLDGLPAGVRAARMNAVNPRYVLRNYLAQQAIDAAEQGNPQMIHELLEVIRHPYSEQPGREAISARRPDWARHRPGCSMLSCSS